MDDTVVRFRSCTCPGSVHPDGDTVTLRPFLGWAAGAAAMRVLVNAVGDEVSTSRLNEELGPIYLREGVTGWNLVDEAGPIEFDPEMLFELPFEQAYLIADKADDLYTERVIAPLVQRTSGSSANTPTVTTLPTNRSSRRARTRAGSSSRPASDGTRRSA